MHVINFLMHVHYVSGLSIFHKDIREQFSAVYTLPVYSLRYDFKYLQIYAGSFLAIPVIRWLLLRKRNAEIERRNQTRLKCAQALELPDISLRRKVNNIVIVLCPAVIILFVAKSNYSFSQ